MAWCVNTEKFYNVVCLTIIVILSAICYWLGCHWWIVIIQMAALAFEIVLFIDLARSEKSRPVWTQRCVVCGEVCGMPYSVTHRMDDFVCYNCREKQAAFDDAWERQTELLNDTMTQMLGQTAGEGKEKSRKSMPELAEAIGEILEGKYVKEQQIEVPEKRFRSLKQVKREYFPNAVEKEKQKEETPEEVAARIFASICKEMMKK